MKGWIGALIAFLLGIGVGVGAPLVAPQLVTPYLSKIRPAHPESVEGQVVRKQRDPDRLLLTISTRKGVLLATFRKQVEEIDLLVDEGYSVTIRLPEYAPFIENPKIERVYAAPPTTNADTPPAPASQAPAPPTTIVP